MTRTGPLPDVVSSAPPLGVALGGFMGSGTSTVGPRVAALLGLPFADLDSQVEAAAAGASVAEIFATEGEEGFRRREAQALREACQRPAHVLALGGGTLHQPGAVHVVQSSFCIVVLHAEWPVLAARLAGGAGRPLAQDAAALFEHRALGYRTAGIRVDADASVEAVAERVVAAWRASCGST